MTYRQMNFHHRIFLSLMVLYELSEGEAFYQLEGFPSQHIIMEHMELH